LARAQIELQKNGGKFPTPPLPGNDIIVPINSLKDLIQEGEEMDNCVGSYIGKIASGHSFIYRVLEPERATLEIIRELSVNSYMVAQLKLQSNEEPSDGTWNVVRKWMEANNCLRRDSDSPDH
jgi:hypothetical protein